MSAGTLSQNSKSEAEIRRWLADWSKALEAKDTAALVEFMAEDGLLFDAIPPFKKRGRAGVKAVWDQCMPYMPKKFKSEYRNLEIEIEGNMAFVTGLHRMVPIDETSPCGDSFMRVTCCLRKIDGKWQSLHDHISVPFDPMSGKAIKITDPDNPEEMSPFDSFEGCCEGQ